MIPFITPSSYRKTCNLKTEGWYLFRHSPFLKAKRENIGNSSLVPHVHMMVTSPNIFVFRNSLVKISTFPWIILVIQLSIGPQRWLSCPSSKRWLQEERLLLASTTAVKLH